MARNKYSGTLAVLFIMVFALAAGAGTLRAQEEVNLSFDAFAVAMGTSNPPVMPRGATSTTLQINITRWTTDEEREGLFAELVENGQEGLVEALRRQDETGWARARARGGMSSMPSERLRYARQFDLGEGRSRIVLGLDRPISLWESANRPRWNDYDMTLIVLDLDENGEGEGQLAMAVRLDLNRETNELTIENFGTEPVRLTRVTKR